MNQYQYYHNIALLFIQIARGLMID